MATTVVKNVYRPLVEANGTTGEVDGGLAPADHLLVLLDKNNDGRVQAWVTIKFADHAGLQAEWEAGTDTTILQAAIDAAVQAGVAWPEEPLTVAQKQVIGYVPTIQ